jgi:hypothetical protein
MGGRVGGVAGPRGSTGADQDSGGGLDRGGVGHGDPGVVAGVVTADDDDCGGQGDGGPREGTDQRGTGVDNPVDDVVDDVDPGGVGASGGVGVSAGAGASGGNGSCGCGWKKECPPRGLPVGGFNAGGDRASQGEVKLFRRRSMARPLSLDRLGEPLSSTSMGLSALPPLGAMGTEGKAWPVRRRCSSLAFRRRLDW